MTEEWHRYMMFCRMLLGIVEFGWPDFLVSGTWLDLEEAGNRWVSSAWFVVTSWCFFPWRKRAPDDGRRLSERGAAPPKRVTQAKEEPTRLKKMVSYPRLPLLALT